MHFHAARLNTAHAPKKSNFLCSFADCRLKLMRTLQWRGGEPPPSPPPLHGAASSSLLGGAAASLFRLILPESSSVSAQLLRRGSALLQTQEAQGRPTLSANGSSGLSSLTCLSPPQSLLLFLRRAVEQGGQHAGQPGSQIQH